MVRHTLPPRGYIVGKTTNRDGRSWDSWLEAVAGMKRYPQLRVENANKPPGKFEYIIKHRSDKLSWVFKSF